MDQVVAHLLARYAREGWAPTLMGIGPMSSLVVRAALEQGREADFPVILIARRNQVDSSAFGGGYVEGWTQQAFAAQVAALAREAGFDGLLYVCRDHGGPWHRDEELRAALPAEEAMASAAASYRVDLEAGFHLLHVDPTRDPTGTVPLEVVIQRSLALTQAIEGARKDLGLPPVSYEIGTEETSGGLTAETAFAAFIANLLGHLKADRLPRPAFIVGQTGTLVKMRENVGSFDAAAARHLAGIAREHGLGFKEHNADYLPDDVLAAHPQLGITAANVAPEFGVAETEALLALADREAAVIERSPKPDVSPSGLRQVIEEKALASRRWVKWLRPAEKATTEEDLRRDQARRKEVTAVCGHYVFTDPQVAAARQRLYDNAQALGIASDPAREVLEAVKASIAHYVEPFRLAGLTTWLRAQR
jgi:tagatose-1,6-bisphosphate aldolase non-catalytic subunit AgaZ/GatZ